MSFHFRYLTYPVRRQVCLTLEPDFPVTIQPQSTYTLEIKPFSGLRRYGLRHTDHAPGEAEAAFLPSGMSCARRMASSA